MGVTQKAHSGYLPSTWERSYRSGETGEAVKDGALKSPTADGSGLEEGPAKAAVEGPPGRGEFKKQSCPTPF